MSAPCAYADLPPKRLAASAPYLRMVNRRLLRLPSTEGWRGQLLGSYDFWAHLGYGKDTTQAPEEMWPQWLFGRPETLLLSAVCPLCGPLERPSIYRFQPARVALHFCRIRHAVRARWWCCSVYQVGAYSSSSSNDSKNASATISNCESSDFSPPLRGRAAPSNGRVNMVLPSRSLRFSSCGDLKAGGRDFTTLT